MEFLSSEFLAALLSIVMIDLVLGGDNAIVIGLAARNLPQKDQKKVIFLGTAGAIVIRAITTIIAVWLLRIPGLLLVGGTLLLWMAYKLLTEDKGHDHVQAGASVGAAIRTIIIADAVMGIDNVLAVAGAAHGSYVLVIAGLLISIPIVVWGSTLVIKAMKRFPVIIDIGSGVIAFTAAKMIIAEPFVKSYLVDSTALQWGIKIFLVTAVLAAGKLAQKNANAKKLAQEIETAR